MKKLYWLLVMPFFIASAVAKESSDWRTPDIDDLVYMQTSEGLVVIELAPFMAPRHSTQFSQLVKEGFYDGLDFYRVIDGFVAQGGDITEEKPSKVKKTLKAEFTRPILSDSVFVGIQKPEYFAPETGYLHGFSAGRDLEAKQEWILHCPGTVAMARNNEAHSGTTDFYIVIGQATRHLDRNMSTFGRVLVGLNNVQRLNRASINVASGVIEDPTQRSKIEWIKMAADIPQNQRLKIEVIKADASATRERLAGARKMDNPFFHFQGNGNLDLCYHQLKVRVSQPNSLDPK